MDDHSWLGYTESALISLPTLKCEAACLIFHLASKKRDKLVVFHLAVEPPPGLSQIQCYSQEPQHVAFMECLWKKSYLFRNAIWKIGLGKEPVEEVTSRQICVDLSHDTVNHSEVQLLPQPVSLEEEAVLGKDSHLLHYGTTTDHLAS